MGQYYEEDEIKCAMFELLIKDLKYDLNKRFVTPLIQVKFTKSKEILY